MSDQTEDELRPVTVLFADIVGSTALGERLAPEEVKALVGECVTQMSRAVEQFGGFVQAYMGDGLCAYFGVPAAREDDHERAARTALRIVELVREYAREIEAAWGISGFNVRVGINSGPTAVGFVGGSDPQPVALGDTTNVAARLQTSAEPGTIVVGELAAGRLAHRFVLEPLGGVRVKGRADAVPAWALTGLRSVAQAPVRTPLIGRERELEVIRQAVTDVEAGRGQVLLFIGEAGIGKSRLLRELQAIAHDRVVWLEGQCPSYGGDLLYWPFAQALRRWLGADETTAEVALRTKLRARLTTLGGIDLLTPLGRLLSLRLDTDGDGRGGDHSAESIQSAYREWVVRIARERPVVLAIEDLEWADASSRELAEELLTATDVAPLLFVATLRTETTSQGWQFRIRALTEFPHRAREIELGPLEEAASAHLLSILLPGLDEAAKREIAGRAEGNPLYLQELLRAVADAGGFERRRTWTLRPRATEQLPPALEGLLVARVDRLPVDARRLAQAAAVVGRTFSLHVVERVLGEADVGDALRALLRAEIVREAGREPERRYAFTHRLLQDAVLATLTSARRTELYGRVANAYETLFPDATGEHLELLAHYYARSNELSKAIRFLERAGEEALALDARDQAQRVWERARRAAEAEGDADTKARLDERIAAIRA
jgi:class 3 adenylate cyclase